MFSWAPRAITAAQAVLNLVALAPCNITSLTSATDAVLLQAIYLFFNPPSPPPPPRYGLILLTFASPALPLPC